MAILVKAHMREISIDQTETISHHKYATLETGFMTTTHVINNILLLKSRDSFEKYKKATKML